MKTQKPMLRREAIAEALQACGEASASRIAQVLGWRERLVCAAINRTRSKYPGQFFRVARFEWPATTGRTIPIYAAEAGEDASPLRASAERIRQRKADFRNRNREEINRRARQSARERSSKRPPRAPVVECTAEMGDLPVLHLPLSAQERKALVEKYYPHMSTPALAAWLGVSALRVQMDNRPLGLLKTAQTRSRTQARTQDHTTVWQWPLVEILELMYPVMTAPQLQELTGIPVFSIRRKASLLKRNADRDQRLAGPPSTEKIQPAKAVPQPQAKVRATGRRALRRADPAPTPEKFKMPTKMTDAMRARMDKERFHLTDEIMGRSPMFRPLYVPTALAYRGQRA